MDCKRLLQAGVALIFCTTIAQNLKAQPPKKDPKYPSLLWEITGKGMKKPSYLFGTMHVSSKKVFHLSDSFFIALRNADVVALELNPDIWQKEMVALDKEKADYMRFYGNRGLTGGNLQDYTFRLEKDFLPYVKVALQESPMIINSLLYRSRDSREDFEENTFLDMYIYQTGKKLGKRASGVENFYEMERLTLEAEIDQSKEKNRKKKKYDYDYDENPRLKSDEAYRKGDLDLLDSLNKMMFESDAFMEKFLYRRNEIQAYSMDTIMKKGHSLFVGVGCAHLPGDRGVIEELRKMGYRLRPIKMLDRDARQREQIDNRRVPVMFGDFTSPDGFYKVRVPGDLYKRDDTESGLGWQYADMSNGAYYTVTRIPTLSAFAGFSEAQVMKQIDSILYENIPGKIVKKTPLQKNGFTGLDILNKTRRGDLQRYNIFVTPFEVVIFKMSGVENYVQNGKEANDFFNSIQLTPYKSTAWMPWQPSNGGFAVQMPHKPFVQDELAGDWTWAATDPDGTQYLLRKRTVFDKDDLPADTLLLGLMEESFTGSEKKLTRLERVFGQQDGASTLQTLHSRNDSFLHTRYIMQGPHHFLVAAKGKNKSAVTNNKLAGSFRLTPFTYGNSRLLSDTFVKFSARTPLAPRVRDSLKALLQEYADNRGGGYYGSYRYSSGNDDTYSYSDLDKNMVFTNDTTGEVVKVSVYKTGKYYMMDDADSVKQLRKTLDSLAATGISKHQLYKKADSIRRNSKVLNMDAFSPDSIYIVKKAEIWSQNGERLFRLDYSDSGSTRLVKELTVLKDDYTYTVQTLTHTGDTLADGFTERFFNSFRIAPTKPGNDVFASKVDTFFKDYYSTDTSRRKIARSGMNQISFKKQDLPRMVEAIGRLSIKDKDYFETKTLWIGQIASIGDSTAQPQIIAELKRQYEKAGDTSKFQNAVLKGLASLHTKEGYAVYKQYLLQDPPVETGSYEDNFMEYEDSLELVKTLFPEILQLTSLDDYKSTVNGMLVRLVDSSRITAKEYESYFTKILFDARIALKKQQKADEKKVEEELSKDENEDEDRYIYSSYRGSNSNDGGELADYATLLLPFYDQNPAVPKYIEKLWQTRNDGLKYALMLKLLHQKRAIPDSMVNYFAQKEEKRGQLYYDLHKLKKLNLFPAQYKNQQEMARAFLYTGELGTDEEEENNALYNSLSRRYQQDRFDFSRLYRSDDYRSNNSPDKKMDSIIFVKKELVTVGKKKGYLYIYKYRKDKDDKWRIAISGLQPEKTDSISYRNVMTDLTDEKLNEEEGADTPEEQYAMAVKKAIYAQNPATRSFFTNSEKRLSMRKRALEYIE
jgi:uncharacterized protein YbaP (TraB family)